MLTKPRQFHPLFKHRWPLTSLTQNWLQRRESNLDWAETTFPGLVMILVMLGRGDNQGVRLCNCRHTCSEHFRETRWGYIWYIRWNASSVYTSFNWNSVNPILSWSTKVFVVRMTETEVQGRWDGSVGKACSQGWRPEFDPRDSHGERRLLQLSSDHYTSTCMCPCTSTNINVMNRSS